MTHYPDAVALTRKLLSFNTINPPGAEEACASHLGSLLEAAGFRSTMRRSRPRARASLRASDATPASRRSDSPGTSTPYRSAQRRGSRTHSAQAWRAGDFTVADRAT